MKDDHIDPKRLAERMIKVTHMFAHAVKNKLSPHEMHIAPNQMHILKMISHHTMTISELARAQHVSAPTMSSTVDKLSKKGFLKRERSSEDRRMVHVSVTQEGEILMSEMFEIFIKEVSQILEPLTQEEKGSILKGFGVLEKAISDALADSGLHPHDDPCKYKDMTRRN